MGNYIEFDSYEQNNDAIVENCDSDPLYCHDVRSVSNMYFYKDN